MIGHSVGDEVSDVLLQLFLVFVGDHYLVRPVLPGFTGGMVHLIKKFIHIT